MGDELLQCTRLDMCMRYDFGLCVRGVDHDFGRLNSVNSGLHTTSSEEQPAYLFQTVYPQNEIELPELLFKPSISHPKYLSMQRI
jgi:hypothetical protein